MPGKMAIGMYVYVLGTVTCLKLQMSGMIDETFTLCV